MNKPSIGRIVHYVLPNSHNNKGEIRPAVIVRIRSDTCVSLCVFLDKSNDHILNDQDMSSVTLDPEGKQPRSWNWPPRV